MILNRGGSSLTINTSSSVTTENGDVQLTPKKLSIETKDQRRLVEYFVVVSSVLQTDNVDTTNQSPNDNDSPWNFQPMITSRYPLTDHADNPLCDITDFCHPSGNIQHSDAFQMPKVRQKKNEKKIFLWLRTLVLSSLPRNPFFLLLSFGTT